MRRSVSPARAVAGPRVRHRGLPLSEPGPLSRLLLSGKPPPRATGKVEGGSDYEGRLGRYRPH